MLVRYERGAALPPPPTVPLHAGRNSGVAGGGARASASAPIAIGGAGAHWRGGAGMSSVSPMESDEDTAFPLSRSWDDCEVARSILNLNSPNGFHPVAGNSMHLAYLPPQACLHPNLLFLTHTVYPTRRARQMACHRLRHSRCRVHR